MRQFTIQAIKRNLFATMFLAPFIPVLLALGAGGYLYWHRAQDDSLEHLTLLSRHYVYILERYIDDCLGDMALVDDQLSPQSGPAMLKTVLENLEAKHKEILDVALVDEGGVVLAYAGPSVFKGTHVTPDKWLDEAIKRGRSVSGVMSGQMGIPHCVLALRQTFGEKSYVLRASLDPAAFTRILMDVREEGVDVFLINREGEVIAGSGGQVLTRDQELAEPVFLDRVGMSFWDDSSKVAYASRVMRHTGWILAVRKHSTGLVRAFDNAVLFLGLAVLCGGIVVFLTSLYLTGYVEKMLRQREEEREKLREQLYRAGRLAELGEMAAGFAHEINNPLQIMKSEQAYVEMLLQDCKNMPADDPDFVNTMAELSSSVDQIKAQIDRCARITHSILSFGRVGNVEEQNVDLAKFIPEVLTMIQKKIQLNNILLRTDMSPSRLIVHVDPGRLQQVLLNLLNNAIHAVGEVADGRVGEITLSCAPEDPDRVRIAIQDNGAGISPEHQQLIFTPFFTTKPAGSGTGLGLSLCHGIVDSMNGVLDFTSAKGQGSTFFILLPKVSSAAS